MTAAQSVLILPELLSEVLIHLPFEDVMRSRGVNKMWLGVIDTCPEILWNTWRSPTPPKSYKKKYDAEGKGQSPCDFEPFKPFFERTLINVDELVTGILPNEPPLRIMQRQFIRESIEDFLNRNSNNLKPFYITRPPLQMIESSIKVITAGRKSLITSSDRGFTIRKDEGITVDTYLQALLECLEKSWGTIALPATDDAAVARNNGELVRKKRNHRLETQLLTMKKEWSDPVKSDSGKEEWENGVMSSTLIIKVNVTDTIEEVKPRRGSWWQALYSSIVGSAEE
ncbi:hypothetical protein ABW19_dt0208531 [Dactylella cylindrospora]|nr:hypothetical protein ABW19_dt0208531 [Dactylella cylindrospora]